MDVAMKLITQVCNVEPQFAEVELRYTIHGDQTLASISANPRHATPHQTLHSNRNQWTISRQNNTTIPYTDFKFPSENRASNNRGRDGALIIIILDLFIKWPPSWDGSAFLDWPWRHFADWGIGREWTLEINSNHANKTGVRDGRKHKHCTIIKE